MLPEKFGSAYSIKYDIHISSPSVGGTPLGLYKVGGSNLPVVVIVLLISTGLAIAIFVTSRWDRAPVPYHRPFFATLGFLTSIVWIYAIAHELVNSLEALGIVWEISETILGVTAMAFASSVGGKSSNDVALFINSKVPELSSRMYLNCLSRFTIYRE